MKTIGSRRITFLISVYVMTPQYFTARAFYLLCVLKDFSEDYTGEVDSGGADLNVSFSIVGELEEKPFKSEDRLPITIRPINFDDNGGLKDIIDLRNNRPSFKLDYEDDSLSRANSLGNLALDNTDTLCQLDRETLIKADTRRMWAEYKKRQEEGKGLGVIIGESGIHWDLLGG